MESPFRVWARPETQAWVTYESLSPEAWPRDQCRWKYLVSKDVCGATDLLMGICVLDPGGVHLRHHHPRRSEFYYVLSGRAPVTVGDQTVDARPGTAIYIRAGTTHGFVNDGPEPFTILWAFNVPPGHEGPDLVWDEPLSQGPGRTEP
jgi:mannose-6-phosphate isomerase-like protein (cupin superfamily)